ncbi:MAG: MBL fold metallo-hydrolase [Bacteroidota bacterium]
MEQVKTLVFNPFQVNTYIIYDENGKCVIIDPAFSSASEEETFETFLSRNRLSPVAQLNTHCHVDHLPGVTYLREQHHLPFHAHPGELDNIRNAPLMGQLFGFTNATPDRIDRPLHDGELISFGSIELQVLHVPGHSEGSLAFYSAAGGFVITGDALFQGSIGRTDLPGGDYDTLIASIRTRLLTLPAATRVYPGHGPYSSIGQENSTNPFLKE